MREFGEKEYKHQAQKKIRNEGRARGKGADISILAGDGGREAFQICI